MEEKTLSDLQNELTSLGMPAEEVKKIAVKSLALAMINTLKASKVVEKVDSLVDKETPVEHKAFEQQYLTKAKIMRDLLMSQPKVRYMIPLEGEEKPGVVEWRTDKRGQQYQVVISGAFEAPQINGFKYFVPKGVRVDVPEGIADVLDKSYHLTQIAGEKISMDRVDEKTGKSMKDIL